MAPALLLPEIEQMLRRASPQRTAATLDRITELFLHGGDRLTEEQVQVFDEVLGRLIVEIETKALVALAQRLAPLSNAPEEVVRSLARHGEIAVAQPLLQQSPRLTETDLIAIALHHGQDHLLAISGRKEIGLAVTDVLVRRGDRAVARGVAQNHTARISETAFAALVMRAGQDPILAERVGARSDVPAPLFRKLVMEATALVQARLLVAATPETRAEITTVLVKVADQVGARAGPLDYAAARAAIEELQRRGQLQEDELVRLAQAGKTAETVLALSTLSGVPVEIIERLVTAGRPDPVLILGKAMQFRWSTVASLLSVGLGTCGLPASGTQAQFERLSAATAARVLHFWRARPAGAYQRG